MTCGKEYIVSVARSSPYTVTSCSEINERKRSARFMDQKQSYSTQKQSYSTLISLLLSHVSAVGADFCSSKLIFWSCFAVSSSSLVYVFVVLVVEPLLSECLVRRCVFVSVCLSLDEGSFAFLFPDEVHFSHSLTPTKASSHTGQLKRICNHLGNHRYKQLSIIIWKRKSTYTMIHCTNNNSNRAVPPYCRHIYRKKQILKQQLTLLIVELTFSRRSHRHCPIGRWESAR